MGIGICKNDVVIVMRGKDRGKEGRVLRVDPKKDRILVEGVNMVLKTYKRGHPKAQEGGRVKSERSVHISNVMLKDPKTGKATRLRNPRKNGSAQRIAVKSGDEIVVKLK